MTGDPQAPALGVADDVVPPRSWVRLLIDPYFGRFFFGRLVSSSGVWIHNVVSAVVAFQLSGSALVVGLVGVAQFLPQFVLAPLSGAVADRGNRRLQVIAGRLVVAAGSGGLGLWLAFATVEPEVDVVAIVISACIVGIGFAMGSPAMYAMVPVLVRPNELSAAVALNSAPVTLARAVGPLIGAAVALTLGPPFAFALAALANVVFALALVTLRGSDPARRRTDNSVRAAARFLWRDRTTLILILGVAAVGIGTDPALTLTPSIAERLGGGAQEVGIFSSAFGIGAGVAFLIIPLVWRFVDLATAGLLGLTLIAAGLVWLVFSRDVTTSALAFGVSGLGMSLGLTSLSSLLQERVPDSFRGRIMAFWSMAFLGSRPFAAATNGALADFFSIDTALLAVAAVMVAAVIVSRRSVLSRPPLEEP